MRQIRVLIVDDSATARALLSRTLESAADLRVVGQAKDGEEAIALTRDLRPDIVTMDVRMPTLDGLIATERIMAQFPTPIVIVSSSVDAPDLQITFNALRAGALDVIEKPRVLDADSFAKAQSRLVAAVRAMSEVKVVRRRHVVAPPPAASPDREHRLVVIGASTGGPQLLGEVFSRMPREFPSPIVVVQHMAPGFTGGFTRWLAGETKLDVRIAEHDDALVPGRIYIAPDDRHTRVGQRWRIALSDDAPVGRFRPSVDVLFNSVAENVGKLAVGVLLTGMGSDGADGLKAMHDVGAWTIAQDAASCIVGGMPEAARALFAVKQTLSPDQIPPALCALTKPR